MTLLEVVADSGIGTGAALGGLGGLAAIALAIFKNSSVGKRYAEAEEKRRIEDEARRAEELQQRKDELEIKRQQLALISNLSDVLPQVAKDFGAAIADLHVISRDLRETVVLMKEGKETE